MGEQDNKSVLYYNRPLAKSTPKEVYSKNSQILIAWYKNCLQEAYVNGLLKNLNESIAIKIDLTKIGKTKGLSLSALSNFKKRVYRDAEEFLMSNNPAIYVEDVTNEKGVKEKRLLNIFAGLDISQNGELTIHSSPPFQKYYISNVLAHPELQVGIEFYLLAKSQYSEGVLELILACIADRRADNQIESSFDLSIPLATMREKVPTKNDSAKTNTYMKLVVKKAVEDINANPASPIRINDIQTVKGPRGVILDVVFSVEFTEAVRTSPPFTTYATNDFIDPITKCPSMDYVLGRLDAMHVSEVTINKAKKKPLPLVAACLMYTLSKGGNPALFNTAVNNWRAEKSIQEYASDVRLYHPELMDDVIASIIGSGDPVPMPLAKTLDFTVEDVEDDEIRHVALSIRRKIQQRDTQDAVSC